MFNNIGEKIKIFAEVLTLLGIVASVITGFVFIAISYDTMLMGLLICIFGPLVSWLSSLTLYGFGQLIENSDILVEQYKNKPVSQNIANDVDRKPVEHKWKCADCGNMISENVCPVCNKRQN